jgi:hypothetical protein
VDPKSDLGNELSAVERDAVRATNLSAALKLASKGIAIFPATVTYDAVKGRWDKKPCVRGWQGEAATTDPEKIADYWRRFPDALPAYCTHDFIIVDPDRHADGPDGVAAWNELAAQHSFDDGVVPKVKTAGGGLHLMFRQSSDEAKRVNSNSSGSLPPGINVRGGRSGFVIAPGAMRSDGKQYTLLDGPDISDAPEMPEWLATIIHRPRPADVGAPRSGDAQVRQWSERAPGDQVAILRALASIPYDPYENWFYVTMICYRIGAIELCDAWSAASSKFDKADQQKRYSYLSKYTGNDWRDVGSLMRMGSAVIQNGQVVDGRTAEGELE